MKQAVHPILRSLTRRYFAIRLVETVLVFLGIALIAYSLLRPVTENIIAAIVSVITSGVVFYIQSRNVGIWKLDQLHIANFLNRVYPQLQDSSDLLVSSPTSPLEEIQREKTHQTLKSLAHQIKLPHQLPIAVLILMVGILGFFFVPSKSITDVRKQATASDENQSVATQDSVRVGSIKFVDITITPPRYTGLSQSKSQQFPLKIKEGSQVDWSISFTALVKEVSFVFSGKDSIAIGSAGQNFSYQQQLTESGFYQIQWNAVGKTFRSDFFPIEVIADEPPSILIKNLPQFLELKVTDNQQVNLTAQLRDDYQIKDALIVATVSKGSGESVKFREEKLRFANPPSFNKKEEEATRIIDLRQLGLEPGDELYFYVEAIDNKYLVPNKARTETFFIALQDTSSSVAVADEGLGVDLMPEYFRSQRQIIIDSEKLLAEKKKTEKKDFNFKSNELGYDQKVLRLRYGQFLGEEFETAIARVDATEEGHDETQDPTKQYGHQHDTENEHNLVADQKKESEKEIPHEHDGKPGEKENPFDAFVHSHDNAEEATFFIQSIKAKLRAALTLMWDAELYLRMYQPEQSLPYQYKILKLLKEISNDSRVYVHRAGFDPPPLKEEKRLGGDLSEIKDSFVENSSREDVMYPHIQQVIALLAEKTEEQASFNSGELDLLHKAGNELAGVALEHPGAYLKALSQLKLLAENEISTEQQPAVVNEIVTALWKVIPHQTPSPNAGIGTLHSWERQFILELLRAENE